MSKSRIFRRSRGLLALSSSGYAVAQDLERRTLLSYQLQVAFDGTYGGTGDSDSNYAVPLSMRVELTGFTAAEGNAPVSPTGTVSIGWYKGQTIATEDVVPSPTQVGDSAATFVDIALSFSDVGSSPPDAADNYILVATYNGDSNFDPASSYPAQSLQFGTHSINTPPALAFVGVMFSSAQMQDKLSVTQNPTNTASGATIAPVIVSVLSPGTNTVDTSSSDVITASIAAGSTGTGSLAGTLIQTASSGVVTFSNLTISKPGNYQLSFTDSNGFTNSTPFNIIGDQLAFIQQPTNTTAVGGTIAPAVTVGVQTNTGAIDTTASGDVTITLQNASRLNTSTGSLGGTATEPLVNGVATFENLSVSEAGTYQLQATDTNDDPAGTSAKFKIGSSLQLSLTPIGANPKGVSIGDTIRYTLLVSPHKTLASQNLTATVPVGFDPFDIVPRGTVSGNTITWSGTTIRLVDFRIKVPATLSVSIADLVVTADDQVTYTDTTTDETTAYSQLPLAALRLKILKQPPRTVDDQQPIPLTIELIDSRGHLQTDESTAGVQLSLISVVGTNQGVFGGTDNVVFEHGIATFTATDGPTVHGLGPFRLMAQEDNYDSTPATSVETNEFDVLGDRLKFLNVPKKVTYGVNPDVNLELELVDAQGERITTRPDLISFVAKNKTDGSMGDFTYNLQDGVIGAVDAIDLFGLTVGNYSLTAADTTAQDYDQAANLPYNSVEGASATFPVVPEKLAAGNISRVVDANEEPKSAGYLRAKDFTGKTVTTNNDVIEITQLDSIDGVDKTTTTMLMNGTRGLELDTVPGNFVFDFHDQTAGDANVLPTTIIYEVVQNRLKVRFIPKAVSPDGTVESQLLIEAVDRRGAVVKGNDDVVSAPITNSVGQVFDDQNALANGSLIFGLSSLTPGTYTARVTDQTLVDAGIDTPVITLVFTLR